MLRELKKEARTGGGIDAVNHAEGYDHDTLLSSDFSIDEADERVDNAASERSSSVDENRPRVASTSLQTDSVDVGPNTLEIEVHQEEREHLLGAKEGEAVGKILDADRKLGQTIDHSVLGVSVFVCSHERTVDVDGGSEAGPVWVSSKDKTATLDKLSEAIEQQGARESSPYIPACLTEGPQTLNTCKPYSAYCLLKIWSFLVWLNGCASKVNAILTFTMHISS
jgi:hypothetical protein